MKLLFITNGHGEDIIAARIIKELPDENISVYPLVGEGNAFAQASVEILGNRKKMPSGGFVYQSAGNILKDMSSGLIENTIGQIKELRGLRGKFDLVISVGDIVPIIGAMLTKTRFVFVGCAKSDYYSYSYTPREKYFLAKYCSLSFPRDNKTTENLKKKGIKAVYAGNPMMDCISTTGDDMGIDKKTIKFGILPGTRDDCMLNLEDIIKSCEEINALAAKEGKNAVFLVAASSDISASAISTPANMKILTGRFGDILNISDAVIGLSGTGNEQAAGMGIPVISFPGRGVQYTKLFAARQKQLLSHALEIAPEPVSAGRIAWNILKDACRMEIMKNTGAERMGAPGASRAIASYIKNADRL